MLLTATGASAEQPVSFRNDVMAVLSKAGCNQGVCHGNLNGKNGFKLSLRGDDREFDLTSLTRDMLGRRVDALRPSESLILLKATGTIPHEGGKRFGVDSPEHAILLNWVRKGAPGDSQNLPKLVGLEVTPAEQVLIASQDRVKLRVTARFSDGSSRDVSRLAVYEPASDGVAVSADGEVVRRRMGESTITVRYLHCRATARLAFLRQNPNFQWSSPRIANYIDGHVFSRLRTLQILPSPICSDSVFLRRAFLDALGVLPTADEARAFLADKNSEKRTRLIERLLEREEFADHWALKWSDLLRNEEKALDVKGVQVFHHWIRQCIAEGKPLNEFAREIVAGRGSTYSQPAANYYRALRDPQARSEATAQVFLGIRLQCAKCHNHPFERWTQDDYYNLAAFFARVDYKIVSNRRPDNLDQHQFDGEQIVWISRQGELKHPRTKAVVQPALPGGDRPPATAGNDRLQVLADWIADPKNPYFARVQTNRIWFHLFGQGIVDPIDDFRATNPPSNGQLLDALAEDFVVHQFDLKYLVRTVMQSSAYQLSCVPNDSNRDDDTHFSHGTVRPLSAEQLLDAISQVTGVEPKFNGYARGQRAGQLAGVRLFRERTQRPTSDEDFLQRFGKPERLLSCECERSEDTTLSQSFQLLTGPTLNNMLIAKQNRLARLLAGGHTDSEIVKETYLSALARIPKSEEFYGTLRHLAQSKDRRKGLEDIVWAIVNSKEFILRQ